MVYDPANGKVILFGGLFGSYDGRSRLGDTWIYDPAKRQMDQLQAVRAGPARARVRGNGL